MSPALADKHKPPEPVSIPQQSPNHTPNSDSNAGPNESHTSSPTSNTSSQPPIQHTNTISGPRRPTNGGDNNNDDDFDLEYSINSSATYSRRMQILFWTTLLLAWVVFAILFASASFLSYFIIPFWYIVAGTACSTLYTFGGLILLHMRGQRHQRMLGGGAITRKEVTNTERRGNPNGTISAPHVTINDDPEPNPLPPSQTQPSNSVQPLRDGPSPTTDRNYYTLPPDSYTTIINRLFILALVLVWIACVVTCFIVVFKNHNYRKFPGWARIVVMSGTSALEVGGYLGMGILSWKERLEVLQRRWYIRRRSRRKFKQQKRLDRRRQESGVRERHDTQTEMNDTRGENGEVRRQRR